MRESSPLENWSARSWPSDATTGVISTSIPPTATKKPTTPMIAASAAGSFRRIQRTGGHSTVDSSRASSSGNRMLQNSPINQPISHSPAARTSPRTVHLNSTITPCSRRRRAVLRSAAWPPAVWVLAPTSSGVVSDPVGPSDGVCSGAFADIEVGPFGCDRSGRRPILSDRDPLIGTQERFHAPRSLDWARFDLERPGDATFSPKRVSLVRRTPADGASYSACVLSVHSVRQPVLTGSERR